MTRHRRALLASGRLCYSHLIPVVRARAATGRESVVAVEVAPPTGRAGLEGAFARGYRRAVRCSQQERIRPLIVLTVRSLAPQDRPAAPSALHRRHARMSQGDLRARSRHRALRVAGSDPIGAAQSSGATARGDARPARDALSQMRTTVTEGWGRAVRRPPHDSRSGRSAGECRAHPDAKESCSRTGRSCWSRKPTRSLQCAG